MDREEFTKFYNKSFYKVFGVIKAMFDNRSQAEDVLADAYLAIWNYKEDIEQPEGLLMTTAKNKALNILRGDRLHFQIDRDLQRGNARVVSPRVAREDYLEVLAAVPLLPEKCREIFKLSYLQDLTNEEIAVKLGISMKTVSNQKIIAVKKLREILKIK